MSRALRLLIILCTLSSTLWASEQLTPWYSLDTQKQATVNVELYTSSTCPYCQKADAFFQKIEPSNPWLHVQRYVIDQDKNALVRFSQRLNEQNIYDFSVPGIFFCGSRWAGFANEDTTGKELVRGLTYCKKQIEKNKTLTPITIKVLKRWSNANFLDAGVEPEQASIFQYLSIVALMDAYNPCSLFCIIGFFACLFMQDSRKKQIITGLVFALAIGLGHYFQQVYINTFYELIPWLRVPAAVVGLFALYQVHLWYKNKGNHSLFYLFVLFFALFVLAYQQTCVMNWANIFEQWLSNQRTSTMQAGLLQLAYQSIYIVQLLLMLCFYSVLSRTKVFLNRKQKLNTSGMLIIAGLGLILIVYPYALSSLILSVVVGVILFIAGWFLERFKK